ncbi:unnamed protein product [Musa textilis]
MREELQAEMDQLPEARHQERQIRSRRRASHPQPALHPRQQVVCDRGAPPRAYRQRDQELLEHPPQEEADPNGTRPRDSPPEDRLRRRPRPARLGELVDGRPRDHLAARLQAEALDQAAKLQCLQSLLPCTVANTSNTTNTLLGTRMTSSFPSSSLPLLLLKTSSMARTKSTDCRPPSSSHPHATRPRNTPTLLVSANRLFLLSPISRLPTRGTLAAAVVSTTVVGRRLPSSGPMCCWTTNS